ncbi:peptidylprolyl isomerase [Vibrio sp. S4M6]|uniref:peptidylprolyl isomerase n=1 Tax=Vibrio sinus TaxID=2946865 RepID=UPI00202A23F9|nr:peptidylprolyl isomerase [Vibrio sinus]MCL9783043.1 peptidylprolyl isomerase [Vibrio sinus]
MMDRLRAGASSIAIKVILGLIILSFVFAGIGSYLIRGSSDAAATVGSTKISRQAFEQAYQNERNRMQSQLGDYFSNLLADPNYVKSFRKSVLDRMINNVLLEQYAHSLGLRVSDNQIRQMILTLPEFQKDGKFDQQTYQFLLTRAGYTPDQFADYLRKDLLRNQVLSAIQGSTFTLKGEVEAQNKLISETRTIRTITLSPSEFAKKVKLDDQQIETYYKQHSASYTRPAQVKVAYVELSAKELKGQIKVSDAEAKQYYQEHLDKYSTQPQIEVSHILIKDNKAEAEAILKQLQAGANFAKLAKEKSQDPGSAKEGGNLGWIEKGVMAPSFEKAAFSLKKVGELSGIVKTSFGYHIIKLDAIKKAQVKPFKDVAAEIKSELTDQKAADKFYQLQSKLEKVAYESPDSLDAAAKAISQPIHTTGFITQETAPKVLQSQAVFQALMDPEVKEDGMNSKAIEIGPEDVVVVRVESSREKSLIPLKEVRAKVVKQLSMDKGEENALDLAGKIVKSLDKGDNKLLKENKLTFSKAENITRRSPLADVVFTMPKPSKDKPVYGQSKDMSGNIVVVELDKVEQKVEPQYNQQIASQLAQNDAQQDMSAVLGELRKHTDIEYNISNDATQ